MKKVWMERTKKITMVKSFEFCYLLCWISMLITIAESMETGITVFPSKDSKWKGKVDEIRNIIIDSEKQKVYFSAKNKVFSVSSDLTSNIQELEWKNLNASIDSCRKRENEKKCENIITILEFDFNNDIFTCGTNALKPDCLKINRQTLKKPDEVIDGYRPYSPRTADGTVVSLFLEPYLFIGMRANQERGKLFKLQPYGKDVLATTKESTIFDGFQPDFISAYSYENYAYFFLRENGYESEKRQVRYSRLARVCKHDAGLTMIREDKFITLLKTRVQCNQKIDGATDVFYDHLQSTFELVLKNPSHTKNENTYVYAVFLLAKGLTLGSAICRYRVKDILQIFATSYLYHKETNGQMSKVPFSPIWNKITRSKCDARVDVKMKELSLLDDIGPKLLYDDVKPYDKKALFSMPGVSFTSIVVEDVESEDGMSRVIIFAASMDGRIYKILVVNNGPGKVLGEPIRPFKIPKPINSLTKMGKMIYAGGFDGIATFSIATCDRYGRRHCGDCMRDPYCHWSAAEDQCINSGNVPSDIADPNESKIERICAKVTSVAASSTTSSTITTEQVTTLQQVTTLRETTRPVTTEALVPSTTRLLNSNGTAATASVVITQVPTTRQPTSKSTDDAVVTEAARSGANKSYYTEFVIMTILFVLLLIVLTAVLVKITQARHYATDATDGVSAETKKGCHKFCPPTFSKALMNRDHTNGKLMKESLIYKDTTVELNDITQKPRPNVKVS